MKYITYSIITGSLMLALMACEKRAYQRKLPELEHHYYAVFVPNSNDTITSSKRTDLIKLPVQFYSAFTRNYDAVAKYTFSTTGYTLPAVRGVDFDVVDKNGNVIPATDNTYTMIFPQALQAMDTVYVKLLNNTATGVRQFEIQLLDNITDEFEVDIFSTAFKKPVKIK
ncbi:hypothetical protein A4H97_12640 [Niastella yeongjuensis]|uniref:DUF4843 domain-containing protein n=1 Tax=Niastella yeongjuensis TaxID=354355 RepID=A0A1V9EAR9_9BACT|nr:hypothetical protein [Niastella yeongjuensis]OQP43213.1 hypothetical protein A4H97_12640 [Niastella yeongjuensis]SEO62286.1 hypothetical protein SAMN05660816_03196 [Niastella yeongjuensis]